MTALEKIKSLLEQNDIGYKEYHHKPVRTSEEADELRPDYTLAQGAKALIIKAKIGNKRSFVMLVLPADRKIHSKSVRRMLKCKSFSFASEEEVIDVTDGVLPGGVPPFGNLFGLEVYVDKALSENKEIIFNAGDRSISIAMKYYDYERLIKPNLDDFADNQ